MMKIILIAAAVIACFCSGGLQVAAQNGPSCSETLEQREQMVQQYKHGVNNLAMARTEIADSTSTNASVVEKHLADAEKYLNKVHEDYGETGPLAILAQERLDYWRARRAQITGGSGANYSENPGWMGYLRAKLPGLQKDLKTIRRELDALNVQVAECEHPSKKEPTHLQTHHPADSSQTSRWSGTWVSGPYTIVISGGFGSLSYKADRNGTDVYDHATGTCTVKGNEATCKQTGHWHDTERDVDREEDFTLTLSGNTIYAKSRVTSASVTLASGQPCPDPAQCTGFHVGAEFEGTWTRKP